MATMKRFRPGKMPEEGQKMRFRHMHVCFWRKPGKNHIGVYLYNTLIGIIYPDDNAILLWGHGKYSITTSKQITLIAHYFKNRGWDYDIISVPAVNHNYPAKTKNKY